VVPLRGNPEGLAFDPATATLVAGVDGGVAVLSPEGVLMKTVDLGARPRHVELAEEGGAVLVPLEGSDRLAVVGLPTGDVRQRVAVGRQRHDAAAVDGKVFVGNELGDTLSALDGDAVRATVLAPVQPGGVAAGGGSVIVVGVRGRRVEMLDPSTLTERATQDAGVGPTHVVADDSFAYVADTQGDAILVYRLGSEPSRIGRATARGTRYAWRSTPAATGSGSRSPRPTNSSITASLVDGSPGGPSTPRSASPTALPSSLAPERCTSPGRPTVNSRSSRQMGEGRRHAPHRRPHRSEYCAAPGGFPTRSRSSG
jgi:hypothetical protein